MKIENILLLRDWAKGEARSGRKINFLGKIGRKISEKEIIP